MDRNSLIARLGAALFTLALGGHARAQAFDQEVVISNLTLPTALEFSPDGRVFVAEKRGTIKVYSSLTDATPDTFVDLSQGVMAQSDRGLLGMALHPNFPNTPYVYVLYTLDAPPGGMTPAYSDSCTNSNDGSCIVMGRLSRLQISGDNLLVGNEQILLNEEYCQQFSSHSIGDLAFGADGALYVSAGEGGSYNTVDFGQLGLATNPCSDPLGEGGAFRSQDLLTPLDPLGYSGTVLRLDPETGLGLATNPLFWSGDARSARVIAIGLRNPFRMAVRPKTSELWIGDVGWGAWEEINRIADPSDALIENFGWPCYEGTAAHGGYGARQFCKDLKAGTLGAPASLTSPAYEYKHGQAPGLAACRAGGSDSAISGVEFYAGGDYPNALDGSLLFTDVRRNCVWAIKAGSNGLPDAAAPIETVLAGASSPVDLRRGPNGDIYYVAHGSGTVRRIYWKTTNQRPTAKITAAPAFGFAPLQVSLSATDSTDPEGGTLTYAWDLDADGEFDDSTLGSLSYTVQRTGTETVWLRVSDGEKEATTSLPLTANNSPPSLSIVKPLLTDLWSVGDTLTIEGSASDLQDGVLAPSQVRIDVSLHDCGQGACTTSLLATLVGITGSVKLPNAHYPSRIEVKFTATDSLGASASTVVEVLPSTVTLGLATNPPGLSLAFGGLVQPTPSVHTLVKNAEVELSARSPQNLVEAQFVFQSWSNALGQTHTHRGNDSFNLTAEFGLDSDQDSIADARDNCVSVPNARQADTDQDGIGDLCDNCRSLVNTAQVDTDQDGIGDACERMLDLPGLPVVPLGSGGMGGVSGMGGMGGMGGMRAAGGTGGMFGGGGAMLSGAGAGGVFGQGGGPAAEAGRPGAGGAGGDSVGAVPPRAPDTESSCSCRLVGNTGAGGPGAYVALGAVLLTLARRRRSARRQ